MYIVLNMVAGGQLPSAEVFQDIFPFRKVAGTCWVMSVILIAQLLKTKSTTIKSTAASDYYISICACGQIHTVGKNLALAGRQTR